MLELTKTYRSSKEIIEYTNKILGLNFVSAIRNKNNIPVIQKESENIKNDLLEDIFTLKKKYKSIAIITKNDNESKEIYEMLKNDINIDIISTNSNNFNRDLVVVPSYVSKGLEFDGVIAYTDEDHEYQEKDKYLFYVVCTRAQHNLTVYNQKTLKLERKK